MVVWKMVCKFKLAEEQNRKLREALDKSVKRFEMPLEERFAEAEANFPKAMEKFWAEMKAAGLGIWAHEK